MAVAITLQATASCQPTGCFTRKFFIHHVDVCVFIPPSASLYAVNKLTVSNIVEVIVLNH